MVSGLLSLGPALILGIIFFLLFLSLLLLFLRLLLRLLLSLLLGLLVEFLVGGGVTLSLLLGRRRSPLLKRTAQGVKDPRDELPSGELLALDDLVQFRL